jgi:predicted dehydrogenase
VIDSGALGHLYSLCHVCRGFQDQPGSWYVRLPHFNIVDHGIHYLDLTRHLSGRTPVRVKATTTRVPGQQAVTPMIYSVLLEYDPSPQQADLMTTLHFNNIVPARSLHGNTWYLDGTEASVILTQRELVYASRADPDRREAVALQGAWFPEAFGGSMGELLTALAERRQPATSGRDNLKTLKLALAAVEASETGRTVDLEEIPEERA